MGELREAFCEAVKLYCENDWSPAVPELPEVTIGKKHYPIRAVFELATELGDALPDDKLFRDLDYCMRGVENRDLRERLGKDQTYATCRQLYARTAEPSRMQVSATGKSPQLVRVDGSPPGEHVEVAVRMVRYAAGEL